MAYELNGFVDICDCALKDLAYLAQVHPEKFLLTRAETIPWSRPRRGRDQWFVRVHGELFPAPPPCACC